MVRFDGGVKSYDAGIKTDTEAPGRRLPGTPPASRPIGKHPTPTVRHGKVQTRGTGLAGSTEDALNQLN